MKNIDKIYRIGNLIAAQASDDIPNIGPLLCHTFYTSFKVNSDKMHNIILPFIRAIEEELIVFEHVSNILSVTSEVLNDFKEKLKYLATYEFWESIDLFIECVWILFGTTWNVATIKGD